jgi:hypothetical protein
MRKMQTEQSDMAPVESEEKEGSPQIENTPEVRSRESLWGAVLLAGMLIFVVASVAVVGWIAYEKWHDGRIAKRQPSITVLPGQPSGEKDTVTGESAPTGENTAVQTPLADDSVAAAKKLGLSVLNGGGAKGSAGVLADFLKTEGYSKTSSGNTLKDYTGVSVYYASGLEKEAAVIKESVAKKYPQVKTLPADTNNKETTVSQITIILGK